MKALDVAVQSIAQRMVDPTERQRYIGLLESMVQDCESAIDLWQQVLKQSTTPLTEAAVLMNWTGPAIAKKLFDIHLAFRAKMLEVTDQRGNLEDPVIPSAYYLLKPGETGTSYAQSAIEQARQALLVTRGHIETIRTTVPKKIALAPAVMKNRSKKAVPKKAVARKGATKPVAMKKPAAKTPVAKKVVTKPAAKKKALVKKPAPKKAAKKKTRH